MVIVCFAVRLALPLLGLENKELLYTSMLLLSLHLQLTAATTVILCSACWRVACKRRHTSALDL